MNCYSLVASSARPTPEWQRPGRDFNGAALIDAQGREIPITETMIMRACEELEQNWRYPARSVRAHAGLKSRSTSAWNGAATMP